MCHISTIHLMRRVPTRTPSALIQRELDIVAHDPVRLFRRVSANLIQPDTPKGKKQRHSPRNPVERMLGIAARAVRRARVERTRAGAVIPKRPVPRTRPQHPAPYVLEVDERVPEGRVVVFPHLREAVEDGLLVGFARGGGGPAAVVVGDEEGLRVGGRGGQGRDLVEDDLGGLREVVPVGWGGGGQ
jgi:hypothetical protein